MKGIIWGKVTISTGGVTRLDGARDKKQIWRPHVQTKGLSWANVLYWRKCLWYLWDFVAAPQSFAPPQWFGSREIVSPLSPLVTSLISSHA